MNTATDSNCYCGDNSQFSGSPYDVCEGACNPQSECNASSAVPARGRPLLAAVSALAVGVCGLLRG